MADKKNIKMRILRIVLSMVFTIVAGSGDPAHAEARAQVLYRDWHLKMSDMQARSRVSLIKGERRHDAQGSVRVRGVLAAREGSDPSPEEIFFDLDFTTTLIRGTEFDPDFLRSSLIVGYRHRRQDYTIDLFGEHERRMNTDRLGRRNGNFFGVAVADPEFEKNRFGHRSRMHGRIGAGSLVNENGFKGDGRYLASCRYDFKEFAGRPGKIPSNMPLPKGQIFLEGDMDAIHGPGGYMTDVEAGIRFLFFPDADNSLDIAAKWYNSKNPFGHGENGIRVDLNLEGSHTGELFKSFIGNTAGEVVMGIRGEDVATELDADFDVMRIHSHGRDFLFVFDTLQRATWGKINKVEYDLQGAVETVMDENIRYVGRPLNGWIAGLHLDHRSTHGLDRALGEENYNLIRLSLKTAGWDPGREKETRGRIAGQFSIGHYIENSFKKSRDYDARAGVRIDGPSRNWRTWALAPYAKATIRSPTDQSKMIEHTAEVGVRFDGNSLFVRWCEDAYFGEGGFGGLALRF